MKKILSLITLLLMAVTTFAQDNAAGEPEMADRLYADGRIYAVVAVVVTIFVGVVIYLITLDKKISKLEKELKK
ncbi:CcmD family protein [Flectobacillus major]|jgi:CcmD family protein|uniref:CcmD family protein n=1 Tax=Flectobacillus major TaxID=103 RepID=UPI000478E2F8|nr:CcmD family protein [Flectobacillus major]